MERYNVRSGKVWRRGLDNQPSSPIYDHFRETILKKFGQSALPDSNLADVAPDDDVANAAAFVSRAV